MFVIALVVSLAASSSTAAIGSHPSSSVEVATLECANPKSPGPRCLDLVFDRGADHNGIPLNPRWGYQQPGVPIADPRDLCRPLFYPFLSRIVNPACTSQSPSYDGAGGLSIAGAACPHGGGPASGHSDWVPATYTGGPLYFEDHASSWGGDDDYSMNLHVANARGSLIGNKAGGFIHLEFDSDETIDHFGTTWWNQLHQNVDNLGDSFHGRKLGDRAIVTGLMGIDWVHTPGMESHPVYAMAIESAPGDWGFFVRNNGDEGFCSSDDHPVSFAGGVYTFKFDWQPGATGVQISAQIHDGLASFSVLNGIPGAGVQINPVLNDGVYVTFKMPSSLAQLKPFYDGEIKLHWIGGKPPKAPRSICSPNPKGCPDTEDDPEQATQALLASLLTASQKAMMQKLLTQPDTPDVKLSPHSIEIKPLRRAPPLPVGRAQVRAAVDRKKVARDQLQLRLVCGYLHDKIPGYPKTCTHVR
jgi:hypothetical protein